MSQMKASRVILFFVGLTSILSNIVLGQTSQSSRVVSKANIDSLELPSFSIFTLPPPSSQNKMENLLDPTELEKFLAEIEKDRAKGGAKENDYFWIIPMVFYQARNLFSKDSWTSEEVKQGQYVGDFLGKFAKKPDLKIEKSDQESFRNGLVKLRNWFVSLCQDNKTLASMIFTLDDGPFFGEESDLALISEMRLVESITIPGQQASFVLMTDGRQPEPMIIGVLNADKSAKWLKRYSGAPKGKITDATLQKPPIVRLEGYGYACLLTADWSAGTERSYIYLDESLNLRFYYLSW